jgi:hypothetical protein
MAVLLLVLKERTINRLVALVESECLLDIFFLISILLEV